MGNFSCDALDVEAHLLNEAQHLINLHLKDQELFTNAAASSF